MQAFERRSLLVAFAAIDLGRCSASRARTGGFASKLVQRTALGNKN
jgi:hypothetical protein